MAESVSVYGEMNYGEAYYGTAIREAFLNLTLHDTKQNIEYTQLQPLILTPIDILNITTTKTDGFSLSYTKQLFVSKLSIETFQLDLEATYILRLWLANEPDHVDISVNNWTIAYTINNWNAIITSR